MVRPGGADIRLLLLLSSLALAALLLSTRQAEAAGPTCEEKTMNIVAHEDDDLLFQSPDLLEDIAIGNCVRTVFVTAGDAGMGSTYWHGREEGSRAAYAVMADAADIWSASEPVVAGQTLHFSTLVAQPGVSEVNMRLPDGGASGEGYEVTGFVSLAKLWRSEHAQPSGLTPIAEISAIDGSATYTYDGLVATLNALIEEFEPDVLAIQDFAREFGPGDHPDHLAAAKFAELADDSYGAEHLQRSFMNYETLNLPANVFEPQLTPKREAYYAYGAHDSAEACASQAECEEPKFASYWGWLSRQVVVSESATPGAVAGPPQSVASEAVVTLDGSASSDPLGHELDYEWEQTSGPAVALSNPAAPNPAFTAPAGPSSLTFSLVVKSSEATSLPSSVTVSVAAREEEPEPPPTQPPTDPPGEPGQPPRIQSRTIEVFSGRASKHVIPVTGKPLSQVRCEGRLPTGLSCHVRRNGEVVIRASHRTDSVGVYRARIVAGNSAGTARENLTVLVRPNPRAPIGVDLAVPAP